MCAACGAVGSVLTSICEGLRDAGSETAFVESTDISGLIAGAQVLALGEEAYGLIEPADQDMYAIDVIAGQTYTFNLFNDGIAPTLQQLLHSNLTLFDSTGVEILNNDDADIGVFTSFLEWQASFTGTVYVRAEAFSGSGYYGLAAYEELPDNVSTPAELTVNSDTTGKISAGATADSDWYSVQLTGGTQYTVDIIRSFNANVQILDSTGMAVSAVETGTSFTFTPGATDVYYVSVSGASETDEGIFTVTVSDGAGGPPPSIEPTDSITWNYTAPSTVNVFFAGTGLTVIDGYSSNASFTTSDWSVTERAAAETAFSLFSNVANLTVNYVNDLASADFVMFESADAIASVNTLGYWGIGGGTLNVDTSNYTMDGWGVFNANGFVWTDDGLQQGGYGFYVLLHEMAHGFGLAHPHDNGGGSTVMTGVTSPFGSYGNYGLNQGVFTVMSYNPTWVTGPLPYPADSTYGFSGTLMALDIAVLQTKYGANNTFAAGNDTYVLDDVNGAGTYYQAIWDTGGTDEIFYGGSLGTVIDLNAASLVYAEDGGGFVSYVNGVSGGFTIANGVVIENATGGSGDDVLIGNGANNVLTGNDGNDTLMGGSGLDILYGGGGDDILDGGAGGEDSLYAGDGNDLVVYDVADGWAGGQVQGGNDTDTLVFELLADYIALVGGGFSLATYGFEQYGQMIVDSLDAELWDAVITVFDPTDTAVEYRYFNDDGTTETVTEDAYNTQPWDSSYAATDEFGAAAGGGTITGTAFTGTTGDDKIVLGAPGLTGTGATAFDLGSGNDRATVNSTSIAGVSSLNGGTGAGDELLFSGGGIFDMTGIALSGFERIVTTGGSANIHINLSQAAGVTFISAPGTNDALEIDGMSYLTTFGTPATRAARFALIKGAVDGGFETVEWIEAGANIVATTDSDPNNPGGLVVTATDTSTATWANSVLTLDAAGNRLSKLTTNDDGTVVDWTYVADVLSAVTTSNLAGARDTVTLQYDAAGRWDSNTTTYDGDLVRSTVLNYDDAQRVDSRVETASTGFVTTTNFNDSNQRTSVTSDDTVSNLYSWTTSTLTLDPATGVVLQKDTLLDNGNFVSESFGSAGQRLVYVTTDLDGNESFATATQVYFNGVYSYLNNVYDNGTGLIIGNGNGNIITQNNDINDTITGNGGADVFHFLTGMGNDRINDFANGVDLLNLTAMGIDSTADLTTAGATFTQVGTDVVIDFAGADMLTLKNFALANFDDGDFQAA